MKKALKIFVAAACLFLGAGVCQAARTTIATDNFNRASLGANWTQTDDFNCAPGIQIVSSTIIDSSHTGPCSARYTGASFTDQQYSLMALVFFNADNNQRMGVACLMSPDMNGGQDRYEYTILDDSGTGTKTTEIAKVVNNTRTVLASSSVTWSVSDTIEIECDPTAHTVTGFKNGVQQVQATSQTDLTTGLPGVTIMGGYQGDNWEGGNVSAAAAATPMRTLTGAGI